MRKQGALYLDIIKLKREILYFRWKRGSALDTVQQDNVTGETSVRVYYSHRRMPG